MTSAAIAKLEELQAEAMEANDQELSEILDTILLAIAEERAQDLADVCRVFEISLLEEMRRGDRE